MRLVALVLLAAIPSSAQLPSPVFTMTPTLVTVQMGTDMYCGMRPVGSPFQIYCYMTMIKPYDTLALNYVSSLAVAYSATGDYTIPAGDAIKWLVRVDTQGLVTWTLTANTVEKSGSFISSAAPTTAKVAPAFSTTTEPPAKGYKSPVKITSPMCGPYSPKGCSHYDESIGKIVKDSKPTK